MSQSGDLPYNPLSIGSIADSIVRELMGRVCGSLPPANRFSGAGIYAIYYVGAFPAYAPIATNNQSECIQPIYVGKASPKGGRKGVAVELSTSGQPLFQRLGQHAESIRSASTSLRLDDFRCRYLVVEELFIDLAERKLIQAYKPVWNAFLDGFGNHAPGSGRQNQKRSGWDELHPGRPWAAPLQPNSRSASQWSQDVISYLNDVATGALSELTIVDDGSGDATDE